MKFNKQKMINRLAKEGRTIDEEVHAEMNLIDGCEVIPGCRFEILKGQYLTSVIDKNGTVHTVNEADCE